MRIRLIAASSAALLLVSLAAGCGPKAAGTADPKTGSAGKDPKGKAGAGVGQEAPQSLEDEFRQAMATTDPKKRAERLEAIIPNIEDEDARDTVTRQLLQAWAEVGNIEKMEALAKDLSLESDYPGAQVRNAMAYAYAEKGIQLEKARKLVLEALNIIDGMEQGEGMPPNVDTDSEEFKEFVEENRGYFLDTLGWIDHRAGKPREAVAVLEEAARRADHSAIRFHLGEAYRAGGDAPNAAKSYARAAVMKQDDSEKAKAALEQLEKEGKANAKALLADAQKEWDAAQAAQKAKEKERELKQREILKERAEALKELVKGDALAHRIEQTAPKFAIDDFAGKTLDNARLQKKVTVIDFWASWCGPCRDELPIYQTLYEKYKDRVNFLAVSVDDTRELAVDFMKEEKFSFPVAHDTGDMAKSFRVTGLPTIYVIGPCGRFNWVHRGFNPSVETILTQQIEALLAETGKSCEASAPPAPDAPSPKTR